MSRRRERDRRPARRGPFRSPKKRFLVMCEGEVTEPTYLKAYERLARNATIKLHVPDDHGTPLHLVRCAVEHQAAAAKQAKREKDSFLEYDQVWCVFDRDDHKDFGAALEMARDHRIDLAVSNPCFELWLVLHFRESPGMQDRHTVQRMLRDNFLPDYDKHFDFDKVKAGIADAIKRAQHLDKIATEMGDPYLNPTTGVYRLVLEIGTPPSSSS